jgi:hypothetical protein
MYNMDNLILKFHLLMSLECSYYRTNADNALGLRIDNALSDVTSNYNTLDAKISF